LAELSSPTLWKDLFSAYLRDRLASYILSLLAERQDRKEDMNKTLKLSEFNEAYQALKSMNRGDKSYARFIAFIQSQTQAKQDKFWAYVDKRNALTMEVK
jgi:hypothetical protein